MTVKILLDPVLTAPPARCSTNVQFLTWVRRSIESGLIQDRFFYWMVADWVSDEEFDKAYPKHPHIEYIRVPQYRGDRTREYLTMNDRYRKAISFYGDHWDWDILLTVRAGLTPLIRLNAFSPRQAHRSWTKEIWVIEQMPLMSFKPTVICIDAEVQDRFTLTGHLNADRSMLMAKHEEQEMLARARELFTPSSVLALKNKFRQVIPSPMPSMETLPPERMFDPTKEGQFCLAYIGRFPKTGANLDVIYEVMTKSWLMRGGDRIKLLCMSNTGGGKMPPPEHIKVQVAGREEFWGVVKNEMHLILMMHEDAEFHMSLMEPISFGVPAVLLRKPWVEGLLGKNYPFFAQGLTEAYAIVREFYMDYPNQYAKFLKWHQEWFVPTYSKRFVEDFLYTVLDDYVAQYEKKLAVALPNDSFQRNSVVQLIAQDGGDDLRILDVLQKASDEGRTGSLTERLKDDAYDTMGIAWATAWNDYRIGLKALGYVDASPALGHMRLT